MKETLIKKIIDHFKNINYNPEAIGVLRGVLEDASLLGLRMANNAINRHAPTTDIMICLTIEENEI